MKIVPATTIPAPTRLMRDGSTHSIQPKPTTTTMAATYSVRFRRATCHSRRRALSRTSSSEIVGSPSDCDCHRVCRSSLLTRSVMACLQRTPRTYLLQPVHLRGDVAWRDAGDLRDRCGIDAFKVQQDHLAIQ